MPTLREAPPRVLRDAVYLSLREAFQPPDYKLLVEYVFDRDRKFRFDLAIVGRRSRVAVEFQGGTWRKGGGAHRGTGFERDCEKTLLAGARGWLVLPLTYTHLRDNLDWVLQMIVATVEMQEAA